MQYKLDMDKLNSQRNNALALKQSRNLKKNQFTDTTIKTMCAQHKNDSHWLRNANPSVHELLDHYEHKDKV